PHHVSYLVARFFIGAYRSTDHRSLMHDDLRCYKAYSADIGISILFAKAETFGEMCAHNIAIQQGDSASSFHQHCREDLRSGGLTGAGQAGKPDTEPFFAGRPVPLGDYGLHGVTH